MLHDITTSFGINVSIVFIVSSVFGVMKGMDSGVNPRPEVQLLVFISAVLILCALFCVPFYHLMRGDGGVSSLKFSHELALIKIFTE